LDEKIRRLNDFILSDVFATLDPKEQQRLNRQSTYMALYSVVLAERIDAFEK
jgi:hypothetical protein